MSRRSIADALEVFRQVFWTDEFGYCQIKLGLLELPFARAALIDVVFHDFGCAVSLPTSSRLRARRTASVKFEEFEITLLEGAEVNLDASIVLRDGSQLSAVEVIPTHLPYQLSTLDQQILGFLISQTQSWHCFRSIREDLPENLRQHVPDIRLLDYRRLTEIKTPSLKQIRCYIQDQNPALSVSHEKIALALARLGIRGRRRRVRSATIRVVSDLSTGADVL